MANIEEKDSKNNGRWTKVEHQKFMLGLELYGKNWKKIQQLVGSRSGAQIRSHAQKFFLKSKGPLQNQQQDEGTQESHELQKAMSVISNQLLEVEEKESDYSYFFNKIMKKTIKIQAFNFWTEFMDTTSSRTETQQLLEVKRKDSFVGFDMCNGGREETALSCLSVLGDPVL